MKKIVILGSAGSIGESALRVVEALPDELQVVGLAVRSNSRRLLEQVSAFGVSQVAVVDEDAAKECEESASPDIKVLSGMAGVEELAASSDADIVLCSVVGMSGLAPVLAALECGTDVALATKEVLVAAGHIVKETCSRTGAKLLPVDSEHSAIFQCLHGQTESAHAHKTDAVRRILLTASGGPFFERPDVDFDLVSVADALDHPKWDMGRKVTIDSATLMNKGLEIIEARWMFDVPVSNIEVVVHPESIIHSMVEFIDGSTIAQLSPPDMRLAIQYALTWPERMDGALPGMDPFAVGSLSFKKPDLSRFPALRLAIQAGETGGSLPIVLNAANEIAVEMFLNEKIPFSGIWKCVESVMNRHKVEKEPSLEDVFKTDLWAREIAREDAD
ncbi:1-deoxy-D-xylulose-5-phosphate reductoisomerase [PVC group bacterium]|nr:1-deoxy-D-xylulose-5-phosphate reductoisomerase [PVC group bacterium]